jgi:Domain of unknown function (DUF4267)
MINDLGSALAGLLAVAIVLMGSRYLLDPQPAAAGFGIPGELGDAVRGPAWLAVKGSRDVAIGLAIAVLLIAGAHRPLGYLMLAAALVPVADGAIVLRAGGPRAIAFGVHWATAAVMIAGATLLIV